MKPIYRNILAIIAGVLCGTAVNMGIITIGASLVPAPAGADLTSVEGMTRAMPDLSAKHFLMPFLAHFLGTFAGALAAAWLARTHKMKFAVAVGAFFLLGGITASVLIPAPVWFIFADLLLAYLPPAFLAGRLAESKN